MGMKGTASFAGRLPTGAGVFIVQPRSTGMGTGRSVFGALQAPVEADAFTVPLASTSARRVDGLNCLSVASGLGICGVA